MNSFFHKYSAFCCPIRTVALLYFNRTYWKNCVCIFNFIYWLSVQTIIFNYPNSTNRINERFSFLTAKINLLAKSKFQQLIGKHTNFGTFLFLSSSLHSFSSALESQHPPQRISIKGPQREGRLGRGRKKSPGAPLPDRTLASNERERNRRERTLSLCFFL